MNSMLEKHKEDFISSVRSVLDMMYNSKDLDDIKRTKGAEINETAYSTNVQNIKELEEVLQKFISAPETITQQDEKLLVGALATVTVYLDYMSKSYKEAAEHAKIIIANIKANI